GATAALVGCTGPVGTPEPPAAEPVAAPAAATPAPRRGTTTCSPSETSAARFTSERSALRVEPPARATASATRAPWASRYRPGRCTAPTTSTTTRAGGAVVVANVGGGRVRGGGPAL